MIKNDNPVYIKLLIRFLKENHAFYQYIYIMKKDFGYKHDFYSFKQLQSFIVNMMKVTLVNWAYEYNMLLSDSDIFINKDFRMEYDSKLDEYIALFHDLYPKLSEEIL